MCDKQTNADRIRNMSDEEYCDLEKCLNWLQSEVE